MLARSTFFTKVNMKVIIYTNPNGNVSVCVPTGELPIEEVLVKDCPTGAIIVDDSTLPQGDDAAFFDAWELSGETVSVNLTKAKALATSQVNAQAKGEAAHRFSNDSIAIDNVLSDVDWKALVVAAPSAIASATDTTALLAAIKPVSDAIEANK